MVGEQVNVVQYLKQHFGDALRAVHAEEAPGVQREDTLQPDLPLPDHMRVVGRDWTYQCWVTKLAEIYKLWKQSRTHDDFRRGLAFLLLLSSPGTGKTTVLNGFLRWLRVFLEKPEAELLDFIAWAMYGGSLSQCTPELADSVRVFLGALRRTGGSFHHLAILRVQSQGLTTANVERHLGITSHAPALRLLYACLCPLDERSKNGPGLYAEFLRKVPAAVKERIRIAQVMDFMRAALDVPEGELFLMLALVDDGHLASGFCDSGQKCNKDRTWLDEYLDAIVSKNNSPRLNEHSLCIPLVATTRSSSIDLYGTISERAQATTLPMQALSEDETLEVVLDIAQRVARSEGRDVSAALPPEAREAWRNIHFMLGGNPGLLSYVLDVMGRKGSGFMGVLEPGRKWGKGVDLHILSLRVKALPTLLKDVSNFAFQCGFWPWVSENVDANLEVLRESLSAIALDQAVMRVRRIAPDCQALTATWSSMEEQGVISLQVPEGRLPYDASSAVQQADISARARRCSSVQLVHGAGSAVDDSGNNSDTSDVGADDEGAQRGAKRVRLSAADGQGKMPVAAAVAAAMCSPSTCLPSTCCWGREDAKPSMSVLAFTVLLREMATMESEELDPFSEELVRESALDEDLAGAMAPCLKFEMLAILGRRTFTLLELFPGMAVEYDSCLAEKEFLVPPGRLSPGEGQHDAHALSKEQTFAAMEGIRLATVAAIDKLASEASDSAAAEPLDIGFPGVGRHGKDTMLVFVEAADRSKAWGLVLQTKQSFAAERETLPGILQAFKADLQCTHSLPQLHEEWVAWQEKESADSKHPECSPSIAAWDEDAWDQRVVYGYVSWTRVFLEEALRWDSGWKKHPWMQRLLLVSHSEQACWYRRTGPLLRYIRMAARLNKHLRATLRA